MAALKERNKGVKNNDKKYIIFTERPNLCMWYKVTASWRNILFYGLSQCIQKNAKTASTKPVATILFHVVVVIIIMITIMMMITTMTATIIIIMQLSCDTKLHF